MNFCISLDVRVSHENHEIRLSLAGKSFERYKIFSSAWSKNYAQLFAGTLEKHIGSVDPRLAMFQEMFRLAKVSVNTLVC